jgi:hypothetical protein
VLRPAALLAVLALLVLAGPAGAAAPTRDAGWSGLDVGAALARLETEPVHRAAGAPARFDEAAVRPLLDPGTRVLLVPHAPLDLGPDERYDVLDGPVADWARDRERDVVLVVGTRVRVVGSGTVVADGLDELRPLLAHLDVTAQLRFALTLVRTGEEVDVSAPADPVPADPAERAAVLDALRGGRVAVAPGAADAPGTDPGPPLEDGAWIDEALPGGRVRIAALPALDVGAPDPDLLADLRAAHPDDVVLVLRGRWLDAAGPDPELVRSARDHVLGRFEEFLLGRTLPPRGVVRPFLERLALLRSGEPFGRPRPQPVVADDVVARWAPPVAVGAAVALGGSGLLVAGRAARRRAAAAAALARGERARAAAELAALDAEVLELSGPVGVVAARFAEAAERRDAGYAVLRHAREPGEFRAAREAAEDGRALLAGGTAKGSP